MHRQLLIIATGLFLAPFAFAVEEGGGLKLLSFTTLLGEIVTFIVFIWVVMKYVWPPLMNAIEARQKEISDGLAAAEQGKQELEKADAEKSDILKAARDKNQEIVAEGEQRRKGIVELAKQEAETERSRILEAGRQELETERFALQRSMEEQLSGLVIAGASQILRREVDSKVHQDIIDDLKKTFKG